MRHFTLLGIFMLYPFNSIIRICLVFNGVTILEIRINGLKVIFNPTMRTIEASIIYIIVCHFHFSMSCNRYVM